jgi:FG-GAP-like repeat
VSSGANCIAVGDFNGDGKLDLAVTGTNAASVFLGNGDGTFQSTPQTFITK